MQIKKTSGSSMQLCFVRCVLEPGFCFLWQSCASWGNSKTLVNSKVALSDEVWFGMPYNFRLAFRYNSSDKPVIAITTDLDNKQREIKIPRAIVYAARVSMRAAVGEKIEVKTGTGSPNKKTNDAFNLDTNH